MPYYYSYHAPQFYPNSYYAQPYSYHSNYSSYPVYGYSAYVPSNGNYVQPTLPSDYADLLEVALVTNLGNITPVRDKRTIADMYQLLAEIQERGY